MKRRNFIIQGAIVTGGYPFRRLLSFTGNAPADADLYSIFKNPPDVYRPFVRWWWNGDKVEKAELARELRLLKKAGIGGVEINPVKFPARTDDLGKVSLQWLSAEWIDHLKFAFDEAKSLDMTCDLIVGSGWPFGAEFLEGEERAQVVVIGIKKLEGPLDYEVSLFDLFKEADPAVYSPFPGRKMEMLSVQLAPAMINSMDDVKDLSGQISSGTIRCKVPPGKYNLYALVKINGFMEVIQGAPGATGPVLNHYNKEAVKKYLNNMSGSIQDKLGPVSQYIRSFFTDSMELEGSNWCSDMATEFKKRRGYDILPWLPFVQYRIGSMGNTMVDLHNRPIDEKRPYDTVFLYTYGSEHGAAFDQDVQRVRYDFELTKTELIHERFVDTFLEWCKSNKVKSRIQAYGRGYFPLEASFDVDIPEGETWIRPILGVEIQEIDYRVGRAYTWINKVVSSAAHLKGKRLISCEELTNIHRVFSESLELMKIASDQSIISGMTHAVLHGFNYSPPDAPFPGWVLYGTFINERNPWWPYFRQWTDYKARLFALLNNATMFAEIALLPATVDLWSRYSAQNDPFPLIMHPRWQTLLWESIHHHGNACDYISQKVIMDSVVRDGYLTYGPRRYHSIFLAQVESLEPAAAKKLFEFVQSGGRVFCIEKFPAKAPGWNNHVARDKEVQDWVQKMRGYPNQCIFLDAPLRDYMGWYKDIQEKYNLYPYAQIDAPSRYVSQVRYQAKDMEILIFNNCNMNASFQINVTPAKSIAAGKQAWIWDAVTGERYKLDSGTIALDLEPSDLKLLVFDKNKKGPSYSPPKKASVSKVQLTAPWLVTGQHVDGTVINQELAALKDLKEIPEWQKFGGAIIYRNNFMTGDTTAIEWIDIGKAFGVSELWINGQNAGTRWYGRRIHNVSKLVKNGRNTIEIKITTTLFNYMKSLTGNPVAQFWTNQGNPVQSIQPTGLAGPVVIY